MQRTSQTEHRMLGPENNRLLGHDQTEMSKSGQLVSFRLGCKPHSHRKLAYAQVFTPAPGGIITLTCFGRASKPLRRRQRSFHERRTSEEVALPSSPRADAKEFRHGERHHIIVQRPCSERMRNRTFEAFDTSIGKFAILPDRRPGMGY